MLVHESMERLRNDRHGQLRGESNGEFIQSLVQLSQLTGEPLWIYNDVYQSEYVAESRKYYSEELSREFNNSQSVGEYVRMAVEHLQLELARSSGKYCH